MDATKSSTMKLMFVDISSESMDATKSSTMKLMFVDRVDFVGDKTALSNALSDEKPTANFNAYQCVQPSFSECKVGPLEGHGRLHELGGLADGDRDLGGGGRGKLNLAVFDGRRQPRLGIDGGHVDELRGCGGHPDCELRIRQSQKLVTDHVDVKM